MSPLSQRWLYAILCVAVLLSTATVQASGAADEETLYVAPWGQQGNSGTRGAPLGSIGSASKRAKPGMELVLLPGAYEGARIREMHGSEDEPIVIRGADREQCIVNGAVDREGEYEGGRDAIWLDHCSHVVLKNMSLVNALRAGALVVRSHHVTVRDCLVRDNGEWGLFTNHSHHVTFENCEISGSKEQHGIYFANGGSDHCTARGNRIHHNAQCGIHINGDPAAGGDGIISDVLVEQNMIHHNGREGGSAINMTFVQDSNVRNNLCYANLAGGIVLYRDAHKAPDKHSGGVRIAHNTVYFPSDRGRWACSLRNESRDVTVMNNIFYGGRYGAYSVGPNSRSGLVSNHNLIFNHAGQRKVGDSDQGWDYSIKQWNDAGFDNSSSFVAPGFIAPGEARFKLRKSSPAAGLAKPLSAVSRDLQGNERPEKKRAAGCYRRK